MSQPTSMPYRVEYAAVSDLGMRRSNNQDAIKAVVDDQGAQRDRGHFFIVADGMGAHAAGELASQLAVDNIPHTYRKQKESAPPAALRQAIHKANDLIYSKGQSSPELQGMGTTCSCLVVLPGEALVAHVGDSRVYRLRKGVLEQLTFDHSLVWEMAAASHTTADKVPGCIPKNVITRSLGPHPTVNVDLEGPVTLQPGDTFLLCSDGLTGVVGDETIGAVMGTMPPNEACQTLVDLANLRGGPDNISVVIARIVGNEINDESCGEASPSRKPSGVVHPGAWLTMAVCFALAVWFASQRQGLGAVLASAGFGASLVIALMQRTSVPKEPAEISLGGPYGNGPYRRCDCKPGEPAAESLTSVVEELAELEEVPPNGDVVWAVDWAPFNEKRQTSRQARVAGDYSLAITSAGEAIRLLMEQVRAEQTEDYPTPTDSFR